MSPRTGGLVLFSYLLLHDQYIQKCLHISTIFYAHEYMGQDPGEQSSTVAQELVHQLSSAGSCAGLEGPKKPHPHC